MLAHDNKKEDLLDWVKFNKYLLSLHELYATGTTGKIIEKAGFEADDVIGTLARKAEKEGFTTYMMTPDKDYAQLVSDNIYMFKPGKAGGDAEVWGMDEVRENFGIEKAEQMIDILGLMGDSADNIPGCPGIGPKTAEKIVAAILASNATNALDVLGDNILRSQLDKYLGAKQKNSDVI